MQMTYVQQSRADFEKAISAFAIAIEAAPDRTTVARSKAFDRVLELFNAALAAGADFRPTLEAQADAIDGLRQQLKAAKGQADTYRLDLFNLTEKVEALEAELEVGRKLPPLLLPAALRDREPAPGKTLAGAFWGAQPGRITRHLTPREDELFLEALRNAVGEQS
jgi:hypothetical protein